MAEDYIGWTITVSEDSMEAVLHMEPPVERNPYTVEEALSYIKMNGVIGGILYSVVEQSVELRQYYKDIVVARGKTPVDGVDGYYEVLFDQGNVKKPTIRSDGSVDYTSMNMIRSVRAGDNLIKYHPSQPGSHGIDVRGRELRCKPGKDLPVIRGTGFTTDFEVENTGNLDFYVNDTFRVVDFFSHKILYDDAETVEPSVMFPETTRFLTNEWQGVGIYNVTQNVSLLDETSEQTQTVIVIPAWLVVVCCLAVVAGIWRIVYKVAKNKRIKKINKFKK